MNIQKLNNAPLDKGLTVTTGKKAKPKSRCISDCLKRRDTTHKRNCAETKNRLKCCSLQKQDSHRSSSSRMAHTLRWIASVGEEPTNMIDDQTVVDHHFVGSLKSKSTFSDNRSNISLVKKRRFDAYNNSLNVSNRKIDLPSNNQLDDNVEKCNNSMIGDSTLKKMIDCKHQSDHFMHVSNNLSNFTKCESKSSEANLKENISPNGINADSGVCRDQSYETSSEKCTKSSVSSTSSSSLNDKFDDDFDFKNSDSNNIGKHTEAADSVENICTKVNLLGYNNNHTRMLNDENIKATLKSTRLEASEKNRIDLNNRIYAEKEISKIKDHKVLESCLNSKHELVSDSKRNIISCSQDCCLNIGPDNSITSRNISITSKNTNCLNQNISNPWIERKVKNIEKMNEHKSKSSSDVVTIEKPLKPILKQSSSSLCYSSTQNFSKYDDTIYREEFHEDCQSQYKLNCINTNCERKNYCTERTVANINNFYSSESCKSSSDFNSDYTEYNDRQQAYTDMVVIKLGRKVQLGITIIGKSNNRMGDGGIFIGAIKKGSPADSSKRLQVGDQILEVNGVDLDPLSNEAALQVFKAQLERQPTINILIARYPYQYTDTNHLQENLNGYSDVKSTIACHKNYYVNQDSNEEYIQYQYSAPENSRVKANTGRFVEYANNHQGSEIISQPYTQATNCGCSFESKAKSKCRHLEDISCPFTHHSNKDSNFNKSIHHCIQNTRLTQDLNNYSDDIQPDKCIPATPFLGKQLLDYLGGHVTHYSSGAEDVKFDTLVNSFNAWKLANELVASGRIYRINEASNKANHIFDEKAVYMLR